MNFDFYKLCTGKNDLILIDSRNQELPALEKLPRLSRDLCLRNRGVGANGVLYLFSDQGEDLNMRCFRPDGDETSLVNDSLLCIARYGFDAGLMQNRTLQIRAGGELKSIEAVDSQNFRLNLGNPMTLGLDSINHDPNTDYTAVIPLEQRTISMIPVHLQRRGAVFLDGGEYRGKRKTIAQELKKLSAEEVPLHPVFVTLLNREEIMIDSPLDRKNADHAVSCALGGTGAVLSGLTAREMIIHSKENRYYFEWARNKEVFLTGSADYTFSGTYYCDFEE